jgi:hypothetical protein
MSVLGIILRITDDSYSSRHWSDYSGSSAVTQSITLYDHAHFSIYILKKGSKPELQIETFICWWFATAKWATFSLLQWSFWIKIYTLLALSIQSSIGVHLIWVYLQFYQTGCMNHNYGFAIIFHWGKLTEFLLALLGLTSSASIHLPYSTHGRCIMLFQGYNWLVYCLLLRTHS